MDGNILRPKMNLKEQEALTKPAETSLQEKPFTQKVLEAKEDEDREKKEEYIFQQFLLQEMKVLPNIVEWGKQHPDFELVTSEENTGRFVACLRWNFREIQGRKVCNEVGICYLGYIETPIIEYKEQVPDDNDIDEEVRSIHFEKADSFLIWGTRPRIVRYFPHGEVEKAIDALADMDKNWAERSAMTDKAFDRHVERFGSNTRLHVSCLIDSEETEQDLQTARVKSGKRFEDVLIWALNNPRTRIHPKYPINSPFRGDIGLNTQELFDRYERRLRSREFKNKIITEEREWGGKLTTLEKQGKTVVSGDFLDYEDVLELEEERRRQEEEADDLYQQQLEEEYERHVSEADAHGEIDWISRTDEDGCHVDLDG